MRAEIQILKTELEAYNDLRIILAQRLKQQFKNLNLKIEINNTEIDFLLSNYEKFENDWHFGETFIKTKSDKGYNYLTRIKTNNNIQNYNYIYDEVKEQEEELTLVTTIISENNEILEEIVYFDTDNKFKTHLTYNKNYEEYYNSEEAVVINQNILNIKPKNELINLANNENQDFEVKNNIDIDNNEEDEELEQEASCSNSKNWKYVWYVIKALAFISCVVLSAILGFLPTLIISGASALTLTVIGVTVALGFIGVPWKTLQNKAMEWIFGVKKKDPEAEIKKLDDETKKNQNLKENLRIEKQKIQEITNTLNFVTDYFNLAKVMKFNEQKEKIKAYLTEKANKSISAIINEFQINYEKQERENKFETNIINTIELTQPKILYQEQERENLLCHYPKIYRHM